MEDEEGDGGDVSCIDGGEMSCIDGEDDDGRGDGGVEYDTGTMPEPVRCLSRLLRLGLALLLLPPPRRWSMTSEEGEEGDGCDSG